MRIYWDLGNFKYLIHALKPSGYLLILPLNDLAATCINRFSAFWFDSYVAGKRLNAGNTAYCSQNKNREIQRWFAIPRMLIAGMDMAAENISFCRMVQS